MDNIIASMYIRKCEIDYLKFMQITNLPNYSFTTKKIDMNVIDAKGYGVPATAHYDAVSDTHTMSIWNNLSELKADYLVFHEFTHILDAERYAKNNKIKYMANKGYSEFHAAQVDLMKLLNPENINCSISFDAQNTVTTIFGDTTINDYVKRAHILASDLLKKSNFPADIEDLSTVIGLIFNYYGRRSICKMYSSNYQDDVDNSYIESFIQSNTVAALDNYMLGWFNDEKVALLDQLCERMIISLAKQYNLG